MMTDLVPTLEALLQKPISYDRKDQVERRTALGLARRLCVELESPMDTMFRVSWQEPELAVALKVCLDLKIFDILAESSDFVSCTELSKKTGASAVLLNRFLRHIAAAGYLRAQEPDSYAPSRLSHAIAKKEVDGAIDWWFMFGVPAFLTLPEFLKNTHYQDPDDSSKGNWQLHMAPDGPRTAFEYLEANPVVMGRFAKHMSEYAADRGSWVDLYPGHELLAGAEPGGPLIVDVGGGLGHDTEKFAQEYPASRGRLVVQDLPTVIEEAKGQDKEGIEFMTHDFFQPQPIKGARAYFLHSVLHDWTDSDCIKILTNLAHACKKGYSKVLINESAISNTGASPIVTGLDIILMAAMSGRERSRVDWETLLSKTGFRIVKIYTNTLLAYESVIEAETM